MLSWIFQISVVFLLGRSAKLPYSAVKFSERMQDRDVATTQNTVQVCFADKVRVKHTVGRGNKEKDKG